MHQLLEDDLHKDQVIKGDVEEDGGESGLGVYNNTSFLT